jgi:hypothetical protein
MPPLRYGKRLVVELKLRAHVSTHIFLFAVTLRRRRASVRKGLARIVQ